MNFAACLLSVLMTGQLPAGRTATPPASSEDPAAAGPLVPVNAPQIRLTAPRLLAAAMTPPEIEPLAGRAMPLLEVLTRTPNRLRQIEAVQAYWALTAAVGEYHFARTEYDQVDRLWHAAHTAPSGRNSASLARNQLALEHSSAAARLREAELKALAAQNELAARLALPATDPLPLPFDVPHLGSYRTYFDVLFATRPPPPRLRLIDRTLPLRKKAVEARAEAVQAAQDGLEAVDDAYQVGETTADVVAARVNDVARQRQAFLAAVRDYNNDIAEYAISVAAASASPTELLPMLVKPKAVEQPAGGTGAEVPAGENGANGPAANGTNPVQDVLPREAQPKEAPPLQSLPGQRAGSTSVPNLPKALPKQPPSAAQGPTHVPPPATKPAPDKGEAKSLLNRENSATRTTRPSTRYKPPTTFSLDEIFHSTPDAAHASEHGTYTGLLALTAPKRTHRLASLLHDSDRLAAANVGKAITLNDCLNATAGPQRRAIVASYWRARERAARHQALSDRSDQLAALSPLALKQAAQPGGAAAMLDLRAAQFDAQADLLEAEAALWAARLELTALMGQPAAADSWLLPSTPPHGGRYELHVESQPRAAVETLHVKQLTATIPALHATLADRAETVVRVDTQRAAATQAFESGQPALPLVLAAVERQNAETLDFLSTLTRYNQAIADYVLQVLPPTSGSVQLTAALVVL